MSGDWTCNKEAPVWFTWKKFNFPGLNICLVFVVDCLVIILLEPLPQNESASTANPGKSGRNTQRNPATETFNVPQNELQVQTPYFLENGTVDPTREDDGEGLPREEDLEDLFVG